MRVHRLHKVVDLLSIIISLRRNSKLKYVYNFAKAQYVSYIMYIKCCIK